MRAAWHSQGEKTDHIAIDVQGSKAYERSGSVAMKRGDERWERGEREKAKSSSQERGDIRGSII